METFAKAVTGPATYDFAYTYQPNGNSNGNIYTRVNRGPNPDQTHTYMPSRASAAT